MQVNFVSEYVSVDLKAVVDHITDISTSLVL